MPTIQKVLLTTAEVWALLPGKGIAVLKRLRTAHWITPCSGGTHPFYRSADVIACIERLSTGEIPRPIHYWKSALGTDGANASIHLIDPSGRSACGIKREWMSAGTGTRQCSVCVGKAKVLRVENA